MDEPRYVKQTKLRDDNSRSSLSIYRKLSSPRPIQPYNNSKNYYYKFSNRYNKYLHSIKRICLILAASVIATPANAADVGGVSATANPIANSSGSVTNQAIQVLQGPYITNTYGNAISCQGPTMNVTPYVTGTGAFKRPFERYYDDPVYDIHDADDDGQIDNPGEILYYVPTRTNMTENYNVSLGLSATWSRPLDKELQELCKQAATTQINLQNQLVANKRLDFEIARLKNCGELMKAGIMFHPKSPFAKVCADVVLTNPAGVVANHTHGLQPQPTSPNSSSSSTPESPSSDPSATQSSDEQTTSQSPSSPGVFGLFRLPALWQGGKREEEDQPGALLGGPIQWPPSQSQQSSKQPAE